QDLGIVGVADDARLLDLRDAAPPIVYLSYFQYPQWATWGDLYVRSNGNPEALAKTVAQEIESLGREYPARTATVDQMISRVLVNDRVIALLSGFFAALALLLASIGLYGLMSYGVTRRTREIGVRVALGAQQGSVRWMILRETLTLRSSASPLAFLPALPPLASSPACSSVSLPATFRPSLQHASCFSPSPFSQAISPLAAPPPSTPSSPFAPNREPALRHNHMKCGGLPPVFFAARVAKYSAGLNTDKGPTFTHSERKHDGRLPSCPNKNGRQEESGCRPVFF